MASQHTRPVNTKAAKRKSIATHPLFPAVVALWFGALFGLGSLAIRVGLLERIVLASRIDTIIPAAGPPLGVSARILLALGLAAVGALLGAALARRIARPKPEVRERKRTALAGQEQTLAVRARDAHPDAPARRPISASEELGEAQAEAAGGALATGRRRTALAIEHEESIDVHEYAPLPGGVPQVNPVDAADDPLDLGDFAGSGLSEDAFAAPPPADQPKLDWSAGGQSTGTADSDARQMFKPAESADEGPHLNFSPPADAVSGRQVFGMNSPQPDEVLDELGITDAEFEEFHPVEIPAAVAAESEPDFAEPSPDSEPAAAAIAGSQPGMIDLAEQLGQALKRRRERAAQAAALAAGAGPDIPSDAELVKISVEPTPEVGLSQPDRAHFAPLDPLATFAHPNDLPAPFAVAQAVTDADTSAGFAADPATANAMTFTAVTPPVQVPSMPSAMRPIQFDSDDEGDDDMPLASLLPPRSIGLIPPAPPAAHSEPILGANEASEDESSNAEGFSSLLELGRAAPIRQDFIRIEEPAAIESVEPVVIFPGHSAPTPTHRGDDETIGSEQDRGGEFRRFDAPGNAEAGQPVASQPTSSHHIAETEQALRAALANLQRMSGAA